MQDASTESELPLFEEAANTEASTSLTWQLVKYRTVV